MSFSLPQRPQYSQIAPPIPTVNLTDPYLSLTDKFTTVFVGAITAGVPDSHIEQILRTAGRLRSWVRVKGTDGDAKGFGFAVYDNADAVSRVLRIFETNPLQLYPPTSSNVPPKTLKLSIDETAQRYLQEFKRAFPVVDEAKDSKALAEIKAIVAPFVPQTQHVSAGDAFIQSLNISSQPVSRDTRREEPRRETYNQRREETARTARDAYDTSIDSGDEVQRRAMRKTRDMMDLYARNLRRHEQHENEIERKITREREIVEGKESDRTKMERTLRELAENGGDLGDRKKWGEKRRLVKTREHEADNRDRKLEESQPLPSPIEVLVPAVHVPAPAHTNDVVGRIMTAKERTRAIEDIHAALPRDTDALYALPIKWSYVDSHLLEKKISPFIKKEILDILGEEEVELLKFVLRLVSERKSAVEILDRLTGPLDSDAEKFVEGLWRLLVFETESKFAGLS